MEHMINELGENSISIFLGILFINLAIMILKFLSELQLMELSILY